MNLSTSNAQLEAAWELKQVEASRGFHGGNFSRTSTNFWTDQVFSSTSARFIKGFTYLAWIRGTTEYYVFILHLARIAEEAKEN